MPIEIIQTTRMVVHKSVRGEDLVYFSSLTNGTLFELSGEIFIKIHDSNAQMLGRDGGCQLITANLKVKPLKSGDAVSLVVK